MRRLRRCPSLGVVAVAAAALVIGRLCRGPHRDHRVDRRARRNLRDGERHGQPRRVCDRVLGRLRHLDVGTARRPPCWWGRGRPTCRSRSHPDGPARLRLSTTTASSRRKVDGDGDRGRRPLHDPFAAGRRPHVGGDRGRPERRRPLGGTVNPNGQATTWYVEYGTSTAYGTKTAAADAGLGGARRRSVSVGVSGLTAGRRCTTSVSSPRARRGTTPGNDGTFVTAEPPEVATSAASSIGSSSAPGTARSTRTAARRPTLRGWGTTTATGERRPRARGPGPVTSVSKHPSTPLRPAPSTTSASSPRATTARPPGPTTPSRRQRTGRATGQATGSARRLRRSAAANANGRPTTWYVQYGTSSLRLVHPVRTAGSVTAASPQRPRVELTPALRTTSGSSPRTRSGDGGARTHLRDDRRARPWRPGRHATAPTLTSADVNGTADANGSRRRCGSSTADAELRVPDGRAARSRGPTDAGFGTLPSRSHPGVRSTIAPSPRTPPARPLGGDASFATPPRPLDPSGRAVRCTMVGTQAADVLRGTRRRDVICGLGGKDVILGGRGNDVIYGGPGADTINGGAGTDTLRVLPWATTRSRRAKGVATSLQAGEATIWPLSTGSSTASSRSSAAARPVEPAESAS